MPNFGVDLRTCTGTEQQNSARSTTRQGACFRAAMTQRNADARSVCGSWPCSQLFSLGGCGIHLLLKFIFLILSYEQCVARHGVTVYSQLSLVSSCTA